MCAYRRVPIASPASDSPGLRLGAVRLPAGKQVLVLILVLAGLTASACGTTHTTTRTLTIPSPATHATGTSPATTPSPSAHRTPRPSALPPVGTSQRVPAPGTTLIVTIRSLIDPLRGSGAQVVPGTKPVAIQVAVRNTGPGGYDSSTTGDFSLNSSGGQASPLFVPRGPCQTPLQDFMNAIGAGEVRTGCVAFSVPNGQQPTTVGFAPDGGSSGRRRLWSVQ
jgi:hypothetical protein